VVRISKATLLFAIIASFIFGWAAASFYIGLPVLGVEKPLAFFEAGEKSSPTDRIKDYNIKAFDDKIVIYVKNPYVAKFADTGSMEPVLDRKSTGIEITPKSSDEIKAGDIISYKQKNSDDTIIHRVVKIGEDSEGWYAVTKGDNNNANDFEKVRFSQVKRILVGILY
jgi:hypothetical protein